MKITLKIENSLFCARAEMVARENGVARQHDLINIFFDFMLGFPAHLPLYMYSAFIPGQDISLTKRKTIRKIVYFWHKKGRGLFKAGFHGDATSSGN